MRANGTFDVKLVPVGNDSTPEGPNLGRMSMDKTFQGDFAGVAKGEMITAVGLAVKESAAYSAVERLTGTLHGKKGTFALQHTTARAPAGSPVLVDRAERQRQNPFKPPFDLGGIRCLSSNVCACVGSLDERVARLRAEQERTLIGQRLGP